MNNQETEVREGDILVTMTDKRGVITYANDLFLEVANYKREEVMGKPHNLVRHPDMPKAVFKILWDAVLAGNSVSAFVKNKVNGGGYYWVRAFVMPIVENGEIVRIISYRRRIEEDAKQVLAPLYQTVLDYERSHTVDESLAFLNDFLAARNITYQDFLNRISTGKQITNEQLLNVDINKFRLDHLVYKASVISRVKAGETNFKLTEACCCAFGKALESLNGNSCTRHASWQTVHNLHNAFHAKMSDYSKGQGSQSLLDAADEDTKNLFAALQDVVDYSA